MMIRSPRGVEDILPQKVLQYQWIEKEASSLFSLYGYEEIRTPTFEKTELFHRSVGKETDTGKQMYTFLDKKGRALSLRPEATASIVRAYLEHNIFTKSREWRVWYAGPMFRYERPQAARLREFRQIGIEVIGEGSPYLDVEVIEMALKFFERIQLTKLQIQLNSIGCKRCRPLYEKEIRNSLKKDLRNLCSICQRRYQSNILRILDCKKEECQSITRKLPPIENYLCPDCQSHFKKVKEGLRELHISFTLNPYLVRGLDYYTQTIFEIISPHLGAQDTFCAGGRYNDLVEELGGPSVPAIGFSIGEERLLLALRKEKESSLPQISPPVYIIIIGEENYEWGYKIANSLRLKKIKTKINFSFKSLSSQLKEANREKVQWVVIIGQEEAQKKKVIFRNMYSGKQWEVLWKEIDKFSKKIGS